MLDHISFSVTDIKRSIAFYEETLAPLGMKLLVEMTPGRPGMGGHGGHEAGFGLEKRAFFWISTGKALTGRLHVAFAANDRAVVEAFYEAAIKAGGKDNGPPGLRPIITRTTSARSCWIRMGTISRLSPANQPEDSWATSLLALPERL